MHIFNHASLDAACLGEAQHYSVRTLLAALASCLNTPLSLCCVRCRRMRACHCVTSRSSLRYHSAMNRLHTHTTCAEAAVSNRSCAQLRPWRLAWAARDERTCLRHQAHFPSSMCRRISPGDDAPDERLYLDGGQAFGPVGVPSHPDHVSAIDPLNAVGALVLQTRQLVVLVQLRGLRGHRRRQDWVDVFRFRDRGMAHISICCGPRKGLRLGT